MKITSFIAASILLTMSSAHADEQSLRTTLAKKYPATSFKAIEKTAVPGIYQVTMGQNIAYVSEDGRYFFFGALYDMETQTDLTANKKEQPKTLDVSSIPLKNAIVTVKGNGSRKLIVFTDPDCPYCKILAKTLDSMNDITVYNILEPISALHPDAQRKSENIFCSKDNARVLNDWFIKGTQISNARPCKNPIQDNIDLANSLGFNGTPMIVSMDGRVLPGAADKNRLEQFLSHK